MIPFKPQYLFPPRPKNCTSREALLFFEKTKKWVAQFKKNGSCGIIHVSPDHEITYYNRHGEKSTYSPSAEFREFVSLHLSNGWNVFVGEIMRSTGEVYLHDILVLDGNYLLDVEYEKRYDILWGMTGLEDSERGHCPNCTKPLADCECKMPPTHYTILDKVWLAINHTVNFEKLFEMIQNPAIDEGLVLKDPKAKLKPCNKKTDNNAWCVKCRKSTKNYGF